MGFNGIGHFADLFGPSTTTAVEQMFQQQHQQSFQIQQLYEECCIPTGDCVMRSAPIRPDDPRAAELYARVVCSDGGCPAGRYMHRECFDAWERLVLAYMKNATAVANYSSNSARRIKDLWTVNANNNVVNQNKKGYEMAFKACSCRCGRGYLKKDPEWPSTGRGQSEDAVDGRTPIFTAAASTGGKKKKRRQQQQQQQPKSVVAVGPPSSMMMMPVDYAELRLRTGSLSGSSNGSSSPVTSGTNSSSSVSPAHSGSFGSGFSVSTGSSSSSSSSMAKRRGAASMKDVFER